ncbi:MAG: tetratricopeptide repeat protein, partial [Myxococcota bacterium]
LGWSATAERTLSSAFWVATEHRDHRTAAEAATELTSVVGLSRGRPQQGLEWSRLARSARGQVSADRPETAAWLAATGTVLRAAGRLDAAADHLDRAIGQCEAPESADDLACATAMITQGLVRESQRHNDEARALFNGARRIHQKVLGPLHPQVARDLTDLARVEQADGRHDDALAEQQRVLALHEANRSGPVLVAGAHNDIARTLRQLGRYDEARTYLERALTQLELLRASSRSHQKAEGQRIGPVLAELGKLALLQGDLRESSAHFRRGVALVAEANGPDHPSQSPFELGLGEVALRRGQLEAARVHYRRARNLAAGTGDPDVTLAAAEAGLAAVTAASRR